MTSTGSPLWPHGSWSSTRPKATKQGRVKCWNQRHHPILQYNWQHVNTSTYYLSLLQKNTSILIQYLYLTNSLYLCFYLAFVQDLFLNIKPDIWHKRNSLTHFIFFHGFSQNTHTKIFLAWTLCWRTYFNLLLLTTAFQKYQKQFRAKKLDLRSKFDNFYFILLVGATYSKRLRTIECCQHCQVKHYIIWISSKKSYVKIWKFSKTNNIFAIKRKFKYLFLLGISSGQVVSAEEEVWGLNIGEGKY